MKEMTALLSRLFPAVDFSAETELVDRGLPDPLDLVDLMDENERVYGVSAPPAELTAENFNLAASIAALVARLK